MDRRTFMKWVGAGIAAVSGWATVVKGRKEESTTVVFDGKGNIASVTFDDEWFSLDGEPGPYSVMVWTRRLTDRELRQLYKDPFAGFYTTAGIDSTVPAGEEN